MSVFGLYSKALKITTRADPLWSIQTNVDGSAYFLYESKLHITFLMHCIWDTTGP